MGVTSTGLAVPPAGKALQIGLWSAQVLSFALFTSSGGMKLLMPVEQLAAMWHWPGQVPLWFLYFTAVVDVAGGVGVLLPALTRIQPRLTVLAALGCTVLQILAISFHLFRGEVHALPLNFVMLSLSIVILWGRGKKAPILARA
jgi:hypothetical protein